jgi:pimeloyl-ACP methyl ester carboxylesterase
MALLRRTGLDLYYEEHGAGAPILGIHGSPSTAAFWEEAARELARLGRCILYDRRGYHRSEFRRPQATIDLEDQIDDAVALLTHLDAVPAVVIGRSTGGQIALALAVRRPDLVRALVLLEPAVFSLDARARRWAGELREDVLVSAESDPKSASRTVFDLALGPEVWAGMPDEARELFNTGSAALVAEMRGRGLDLSTEPFTPTASDLSAVLQPTLIMTGKDSYAVGRAVDVRLTAMLPHARHEVVPGGHIIDPAHPSVLAFVARVVSGQASVDAGT